MAVGTTSSVEAKPFQWLSPRRKQTVSERPSPIHPHRLDHSSFAQARRWNSWQAVTGGGAWEAPRSAGPGAARAARFVHLTRRDCPSVESAANEASFAARPRTEHRRAVGARSATTASVAPTTGTACREPPGRPSPAPPPAWPCTPRTATGWPP
jgi:hypothetical protein